MFAARPAFWNLIRSLQHRGRCRAPRILQRLPRDALSNAPPHRRFRRPNNNCGSRSPDLVQPCYSESPHCVRLLICWLRLGTVKTHMVDTLTPAARSALMSRIRGTNTKPELAVRRALHALGYRYRIHGRGLPGRPDLVFAGRRTVVFVHGCFWHRHGCAKTSMPKSHQDYWAAKFAANIERDRRNAEKLAEQGWRVFEAWECEINKDETLVDRLVEFLGPTRLGS